MFCDVITINVYQNAGGQNGRLSGPYIFWPDNLLVPTGLLKLHNADLCILLSKRAQKRWMLQVSRMIKRRSDLLWCIGPQKKCCMF